MKFASIFSGLALAAIICLSAPAIAAEPVSAPRATLTQVTAGVSVASAALENPILKSEQPAQSRELKMSGYSRVHHVIRLTILLLLLLLIINRRRRF